MEQFVEELDRYAELFEPAFRRYEQWGIGAGYISKRCFEGAGMGQGRWRVDRA